ncbi:DNA-directed RNA polymerase subunit alpha C-terminal domain-containing protein [Desulfococcaceae bacterium HSG9]|nr:DNA-directed RNA polymerase subunit alpha C-terminal domain-containing protein [Desulfococcaceae bacterium HSG9]
MVVQCEKCKSTFNLKIDARKKESTRVRCSICKNEFSVWCFNHESEDAANESSGSLLDIPVSDKINQVLSHSRRLLHYKEIEELVFKKYGHRHSAGTYLNKSPDVIKLLPGVFIHKDQYSEAIKKAFIIQKAAVVKWVAKQVKSKNTPLDVQVVAALLYQSGKIRYFSEKSIEKLVTYTAQTDPEIIIVSNPSDPKKRSLTKKGSNNNHQTPQVPENTVIAETKETKVADTNDRPYFQVRLPETEYETFSAPPDESSINHLPIFSSKTLKNVSANDLHKNYNAGMLISDLSLSVRTLNVLNTFGVKTIGELVLIPGPTLLKQKNFGVKSLNELKNIIKEIILTDAHKQSNESMPLTYSDLERLKLPPDEFSLNSLPIFSSKALDDLTIDDLHENYKAHTLLADLILSVRTSNVLGRVFKIRSIPYNWQSEPCSEN